MTEVGQSRRGAKGAAPGGNWLTRSVRALTLFISQILDELRKVVRPTRTELWNYVLVVIVFVSVMMGLAAGLDFGFTKLVGLVLGA